MYVALMQRLKKKLNSILLIDDDDVAHFYNSRIIKQLDITEHIHTELNGEEALRYLAKRHSGDFINPDLIFIDVNMPIMNGFEFLENYEKLDLPHGKPTLVMLSSSEHEADRSRAASFTCLSGYYAKPLSKDALAEIMERYFPDCLDS
jgi:CheY-like chemotaxis protein